MKFLKNNYFVMAFLITLTLSCKIAFAQGSGNNAFVFNGVDSKLSHLDNDPGNQDAYQYFNKVNSNNNTITVQAWIYLIGESPNVKMPIVYRSVNPSGTSFSMYVKDQKGYFSVGNSTAVATQEFPAFQWIQLTGIYDGTNLKIYYGKDLSQSLATPLNNPYTSGVGLFVGKSSEGAFKGLIDEIGRAHV